MQLSISGKSFEPGATVSGTATWNLDSATNAIEIRLFWFTSGKGTRNVEIVASEELAHPQQFGSKTFSFKLPESPQSFSGKLITLTWAIELVAYPGEKSIREEFIMAPGGKEIDLYAMR